MIRFLKFYLLHFFKYKQIQLQDVSIGNITDTNDVFCFQCAEAATERFWVSAEVYVNINICVLEARSFHFETLIHTRGQ